MTRITFARIAFARITLARITLAVASAATAAAVLSTDLAQPQATDSTVQPLALDAATGDRTRPVTHEEIGRRDHHVEAAAAQAYRDREAARLAAAKLVAARKAAAAAARASRSSARAPISGGDPRSVARGMLAGFGWGGGEFGCLDSLWMRESGWRVTAANPSGAYGIPQALPGSKMASAGPDWQTNARTQIAWGLGYIKGRYGSPCGAWGHSQSRGWY